jgi:hypothetical protein
MQNKLKIFSLVILILIFSLLLSIFIQAINNFNDFSIKTNTRGGRFTSYLSDSVESHFNKLFSIFHNDIVSFKRVDILIDSNSLRNLNKDLPSSGFKYQKGVFYADGKSHAVKIRYRGDYFIHWARDKKSIRIKTKKNNLYNEVNKFNLISPKINAQINNFASYKLASHLSLITPDSELVKLYINNKYQGIYYYVDQIDESFLRNRYLMPGDVYRGEIWGRSKVINSKNFLENNLFNSEKLWDKVSVNNHFSNESLSPLSELITVLKKIRISGDGIDVLENMFDLKYMARFSLYESLASTYHYDRTHNWRLYYDPWKLKFYPIIWDTFGFQQDWRYTYNSLPIIDPRILTDLHIALLKSGKFNFYLSQEKFKFIKNKSSEAFLTELYENVLQLKKEILRDPSTGIAFNKSVILKEIDSTIAYIDSIFKKLSNDYSDLVKQDTRFYSENNKIYFSVNVPNDSDKIIIQFSKPIKKNHNLFLTFKSKINENIVINKTKLNYKLINDYTISINVNLLPNFEFTNTKLSTSLWKKFFLKEAIYSIEFDKNYNTPKVHSVIFCNDFGCNDAIEDQLISSKHKNNYLHFTNYFNETNKVTKITGNVIVDKDLIFTEPVIVEPGTNFIIHEGSNIFFHSDVQAIGTNLKPITFDKVNNKSKPWGTVVFKGNSLILNNIIMKNGSGFKNNISEYSAMLSIHNVKNILIKDSLFENSSIVDDMVHIVYSKGVIQNCVFMNSFSDALDIDISDLHLLGNKFYNSGNDGLDLMSSKIISSGNYFEGSKDKGISVGEKTSLYSSNDSFISNEIGIEIKDKSILYSDSSSFDNNKLSVNLYDKNWRYQGGGKAYFENLNSNSNFSYKVKDSSTLLIDSIHIENKKNKKIVFLNMLTNDRRVQIKDDFIKELNSLNNSPFFYQHYK